MSSIDKLTQGYDAAEDRLFVDVRLDGGEARRLWLTQRLTGLLVQHLCAWLDERLAAVASGHHDHRLHAFEQQAAAAALSPESAVEGPQGSMLVQHIDLDRGEQAVQLTFRGAKETGGPRMTLDPTRVRQWLGILRGLCAQAGWPTGHWPAWLGADTVRTAVAPSNLH